MGFYRVVVCLKRPRWVSIHQRIFSHYITKTKKKLAVKNIKEKASKGLNIFILTAYNIGAIKRKNAIALFIKVSEYIFVLLQIIKIRSRVKEL